MRFDILPTRRKHLNDGVICCFLVYYFSLRGVFWDSEGWNLFIYSNCLCRISAMILFSYLTDFSYLPLKIIFRKLLNTVRTGKKMTILKGGVDGFSYFSLILVILFSNQDHPWNIKHRPFTLWWCFVVVFQCKEVRNGHIKSNYHILVKKWFTWLRIWDITNSRLQYQSHG
jgi:hypothetical protein